MIKQQWMKVAILAACLIGGITFYQGARAQQPDGKLPQHPKAPGDGKSMVVQLCDGETNLEVKGVHPDARLTPEQAQTVTDQLMAMWLAKQPKEVAEAWARETARAQQAAKAQPPAAQQSGQGAGARNEQPMEFSPRDYQTWRRELEREIAFGDKVFHDDKLLGSTNGVSCAMCHPNAANTHPETYPKFQIQLQRVALLRDMINWCIENPSRGPRLDADDPKMRAMEAYIMAQRRGVKMEAGKH
jgi:thiosulfate dehydrogenase